MVLVGAVGGYAALFNRRLAARSIKQWDINNRVFGWPRPRNPESLEKSYRYGYLFVGSILFLSALGMVVTLFVSLFR